MSIILLSCGAAAQKKVTLNGTEYDDINYDKPVDKEADSLVVLKEQRKLLYFAEGVLIKGYTISLGGSPVGHKEYEGDQKTPEGTYTINDKNPNSSYHKNLGVSYPNEQDKAHAQELGKSPGGDIKIHGFPNGQEDKGAYYLSTDWTLGCIAVSNDAIDELYEWVQIGTPIIIYP